MPKAHGESTTKKAEALTIALFVVIADQTIATLVVIAAAGVLLVAVGPGVGVC